MRDKRLNEGTHACLEAGAECSTRGGSGSAPGRASTAGSCATSGREGSSPERQRRGL